MKMIKLFPKEFREFWKEKKKTSEIKLKSWNVENVEMLKMLKMLKMVWRKQQGQIISSFIPTATVEKYLILK